MPDTGLAIESSSPMRCRRCFYILDHLDSNICPECGTIFDPLNATTFTRKPPFVWWLLIFALASRRARGTN